MGNRVVCKRTDPIVETASGKLRGFRLNGIHHFLGIRYARAERWQHPKPVEPWDGVKNALGYGYIAPHGGLNWLPDDEEQFRCVRRFWPHSEDCLFLNIWSPSIDRSAKKPVMVWLHGGGYAGGSSIDLTCYDGKNLSEFGDVVVVTLNHRLNLLGYFDLSSLGEGFEHSANCGMMDLVAALQWVKENIEAFGGDSDNVTIFGQSGGGGKVLTLLQMPAAEGLFHKAIVMSGLFPRGGGMGDIQPADHATLAKRVVELLGAEDPKVLLTLPYEVLADVCQKAQGELMRQGIRAGWAPVANADFPGDARGAGCTAFHSRVPVLVGGDFCEFLSQALPEFDHEPTEDEKLAAIRAVHGEKTDALIAAFRSAYPHKDPLDLLAIDRFSRSAVLEYARLRAVQADAPTYLYLFALNHPFESLEYPFTDGDPAYHNGDIAYAFHNASITPICSIDGISERVEDQYAGAFVQFAKTGDPNHDLLPPWPAFTQDNEVTMVIDEECYAKPGHDTALYELLGTPGPRRAPGGAPKPPKP